MKILAALTILLASVTAADAGWRRCVHCAPVRVQPARRVVAVTPAVPVAVGDPVVFQPTLVPYWQCAILPRRRGVVYRLEYLPATTDNPAETK